VKKKNPRCLIIPTSSINFIENYFKRYEFFIQEKDMIGDVFRENTLSFNGAKEISRTNGSNFSYQSLTP